MQLLSTACFPVIIAACHLPPASASSLLRAQRCAYSHHFAKAFSPMLTSLTLVQRLVVEWEEGNPRDAHALLAIDADRCLSAA
jgi:hypothetical protein